MTPTRSGRRSRLPTAWSEEHIVTSTPLAWCRLWSTLQMLQGSVWPALTFPKELWLCLHLLLTPLKWLPPSRRMLWLMHRLMLLLLSSLKISPCTTPLLLLLLQCLPLWSSLRSPLPPSPLSLPNRSTMSLHQLLPLFWLLPPLSKLLPLLSMLLHQRDPSTTARMTLASTATATVTPTQSSRRSRRPTVSPEELTATSMPMELSRLSTTSQTPSVSVLVPQTFQSILLMLLLLLLLLLQLLLQLHHCQLCSSRPTLL